MPITRCLASVLLALACADSLQAQPLPNDELERACWLQHTRERTCIRLVEPTAVDVSNLRDGQTVGSPFRIDFSIRDMGVVPAGKPHPKAGHHHLLVNTPLSLNPGEKMPFSVTHRHVGKGQTGAVLTLPGLGHFMLDGVRADGAEAQTVDLSHGATQTTLRLAPGGWRLRLRLLDDTGRRELVPAAEPCLVVQGQERL